MTIRLPLFFFFKKGGAESKINDVMRILEINKAKGQRIEVLNTLINERTYFDSISFYIKIYFY